ncbi:Phenolphthiocerol synthesis polyketide synthase type I Pks15/1 OS=Streptomyces lavendulae subsp. lavendulae OX=58340 GN=SLAV_08280 PE=4 SV=1 [Streptomyces lavendulae subsp. lavendulae]
MGAPDASGLRPVAVYSRPADTEDGPWLRHAAGLLADEVRPAGADLATWPPTGAVPAPVEEAYALLDASGLGYGPLFRGLRTAWRRDGELFAELALPTGAQSDADAYGLHPALFDSALHTLALDPALAAGPEAAMLRARGCPSRGPAYGSTRAAPPPYGSGWLPPGPRGLARTGRPRRAPRRLGGLPVPADPLVRADRRGRPRRPPRFPLPDRLDAAVPGRTATAPADAAPAVVGGPVPGLEGPAYADLTELAASGAEVPELVFVAVPDPAAGDRVTGWAADRGAHQDRRGLALVRAWLTEERFDSSRLVFVSPGRRADAGPRRARPRPRGRSPRRPAPGSAATEHPGRSPWSTWTRTARPCPRGRSWRPWRRVSRRWRCAVDRCWCRAWRGLRSRLTRPLRGMPGARCW